MQTINDVQDSLIQDLSLIRTGNLSKDKGKSICNHVNAIIKIEDIKLQRERINERVVRYDKVKKG